MQLLIRLYCLDSTYRQKQLNFTSHRSFSFVQRVLSLGVALSVRLCYSQIRDDCPQSLCHRKLVFVGWLGCLIPLKFGPWGSQQSLRDRRIKREKDSWWKLEFCAYLLQVETPDGELIPCECCIDQAWSGLPDLFLRKLVAKSMDCILFYLGFAVLRCQ